MAQYIAPLVEIIEIVVEGGFAISYNISSNITDWKNEDIEGNIPCS